MDDSDASFSCRTVFISDIHLGTRGCQAELLLDFIRSVRCERLYLIGDIVDGWKMKTGWNWPQSHNDVVQKILRMARKGTEVIYVPGNHDDRVRDFCGVHFGGVRVARDAIHKAADGKRYLITHGDEFDGVVQHAKWLAFLGDWAYRTLLAANTTLDRLRHRLGFGYWSFSAFVKVKVKKALQFIENAVKYTPAGGTVSVEMVSGAPGEIVASRLEEGARQSLLTPDDGVGRYLGVRVADQGPGIARQHLPRLSERFYRAPGQKSGEKAGTGLGLAIVKHIMNRHRGGLAVESAEGRGAAFTVYFPA